MRRIAATRVMALIAPSMAIALLAGCACETVHCGVDPDEPRFGDGTRHFLRQVGQIPEWVAEDVELRGERLGEYGSTFWEGRLREARTTGALIADTGPAIARDFDYHGGMLVDWFDRQGDRLNEDACCFFPRAWHRIKLAIEPQPSIAED